MIPTSYNLSIENISLIQQTWQGLSEQAGFQGEMAVFLSDLVSIQLLVF